jgi:hypothetical protein
MLQAQHNTLIPFDFCLVLFENQVFLGFFFFFLGLDLFLTLRIVAIIIITPVGIVTACKIKAGWGE